LKHLLDHITKDLLKDGKAPLKLYVEMRNHPGWETHKDVIARIRLGIVKDMLSERFTKLSPVEKDSQQKAYFLTDQILHYLLNPLEIEEKRAAFKLKHSKTMGTNPAVEGT